MYISSCSIRSWNWNRKLTQDHFLIEHWIQRTQRCPAARCWPWVYSLVLVSRYSTVRSETLTWRKWGLWTMASPTRVMETPYFTTRVTIYQHSKLRWTIKTMRMPEHWRFTKFLQHHYQASGTQGSSCAWWGNNSYLKFVENNDICLHQQL